MLFEGWSVLSPTQGETANVFSPVGRRDREVLVNIPTRDIKLYEQQTDKSTRPHCSKKYLVQNQLFQFKTVLLIKSTPVFSEIISLELTTLLKALCRLWL